MKGTYEELIKVADELLETTRPLASNHHPPQGNVFLEILEGIYRRNIYALLSIRYLVEHQEFGDKALDIARAMIEDTISVEYMIAKGKRKLARKFKRFLAIQLHQEVEFMRKLGKDPEKTLGANMKKVERDYKKIKEEFTHKPTGQDLHSWIGKDMDRMIIELSELVNSGNKRIKLTPKDIDRIPIGYVYGNRKNHLNPLEVVAFMRDDNHKLSTESDTRQALLLGAICLIRLTTRYIDEIRFTNRRNDYEDIAKGVKDIFKRMDEVN